MKLTKPDPESCLTDQEHKIVNKCTLLLNQCTVYRTCLIGNTQSFNHLISFNIRIDFPHFNDWIHYNHLGLGSQTFS